MSKIFISYRRQDSRDITGRIYDRLLRHWEPERIFKDVDNIDPGEDYRDVIDREIAGCALFLAVIGPSWLDAKKGDGKRRLDDPHDMVRIEIETALKRNQRVIPLLVGESRMPDREDLPEPLQELADRHAFPIRPDPDFHRDMDRLVQLIERALAGGEPMLAELIDPPAPQPPPPVMLRQYAAQPAFAQPVLAQPAGARSAPAAAYDSSVSHSGAHPAAATPYASASVAYTTSAAPAAKADGAAWLFWAATTLVIVGLAGVLFLGMALIGSVMPTESSEPEFDLLMQAMCLFAVLGNLVGIAAAGCIYARKLYWGAVLGTCAMGLMTLLPCPIFNAPAAIFVLLALFRPGAREAFESS